ncbi:MAG: hypothetical protein GX868_07230 [Actinobacteria bacterium]|nr:hypothetical protein [Actinomycetota bacterium]
MTDVTIADTDPLIEAARRRLIVRRGTLNADELRALSRLTADRTGELVQLANEVRAERGTTPLPGDATTLVRLAPASGTCVGLRLAANDNLIEARNVDQLLTAAQLLADAQPASVRVSVLTEVDGEGEGDEGPGDEGPGVEGSSEEAGEAAVAPLSDTRVQRWVAVLGIALLASELHPG